MAKSKKEGIVVSAPPKSGAKNTDIKKEVEALNKKFGAGFSVDGAKDIEEEVILRYPSGIEDLDFALGGDDINGFGFPAGRVIELSGAESCGKTWLLSKSYANLLSLGYRCLHVDIERTYDLDWARLNGVDTKKLMRYIPPMVPKVEYAEQTFEKIIQVIASRKVDFVGVDSIANLIPASVGAAGLDSQQPGRLAHFLTNLMAKLVPVCAATGTTVVFVNQLRDKMGGTVVMSQGPQTDTPGGRSFKHNCSIRLSVTKALLPKTEAPDFFMGDERIAHRMRGVTIKNKTAPPYRKFEADLYYKPKRMILQFIGDAIEDQVIEKNKANHRKFEYEGEKFDIADKNNVDQVCEVVRERGWLMGILTAMGATMEHFEMMIEDGDLTQEEINSFFAPENKKEDKDLDMESIEGLETGE